MHRLRPSLAAGIGVAVGIMVTAALLSWLPAPVRTRQCLYVHVDPLSGYHGPTLDHYVDPTGSGACDVLPGRAVSP